MTYPRHNNDPSESIGANDCAIGLGNKRDGLKRVYNSWAENRHAFFVYLITPLMNNGDYNNKRGQCLALGERGGSRLTPKLRLTQAKRGLRLANRL